MEQNPSLDSDINRRRTIGLDPAHTGGEPSRTPVVPVSPEESFHALKTGLSSLLQDTQTKRLGLDLALKLDDLILELKFWRLRIERDSSFITLDEVPPSKVKTIITSSLQHGLNCVLEMKNEVEKSKISHNQRMYVRRPRPSTVQLNIRNH